MKFRRTTRYPGGALGEISKAIAAIQSSLEQLNAVYPIHLRAQGNSASIEFTGGDYGGGGASVYDSYFRVIDASTEVDCKVGVTSGAAAYVDSGNCGVVKVNGIRVSTPVNVSTLTQDGEYHVWIHSWVDALSDGHSEIIFGTVDDDSAPNNPNTGILYGSQLAARVVVLDGRASITQDYLHGGEHIEWLFAPCDHEVIDP